MRRPHPAIPPHQSGVALLEVLISILIISFGIMGVLGLQASSINVVSDSRDRVNAAALADELVAQMWVDQANLGSYAYADSGTPPAVLTNWVAAVESRLPNAGTLRPTVTVASAYTYTDSSRNVIIYDITIRLFWQPPGGSAHNHVVFTSIGG